MLEQTVLQEANTSASAVQMVRPRKLTYYEKFMENLYKLGQNSSEKGENESEGDESAIPVAVTRVSALNVANNLARDWVVRNPHDAHPYQFCAEFTDLTAKELRECLRHLMKPIELARTEPIAHNGTNASEELALETNHTFNVSALGGWDACYEAFEDETDKETCMTFVTNKLEGDIAYACTNLDTDEQRFRCKRVKAAVNNVKQLIERQEVVPGGADNATLAAEDERVKAVQEMRVQEQKTEEELSKMQPELKKMLQKTIDISDESNAKLSAMEQAINDTLAAGPQTPVERLGPMPGPYGELPGKEEHAYMEAKARAANRSAAAEAAEAASNATDVDVVTAQMHAIIKRGYNGMGDSAHAMGLMKAPGGVDRTRTAGQVAQEEQGRAALADTATATAAGRTQTLLQVGGGVPRAKSVAGRLQGLTQLEKLARHGNLDDLDSIMDGSRPPPQGTATHAQIEREQIAAAFGEDGNEYLKHDDLGDADVGPADLGALLTSGRHVEPGEKLKSAAKIASQFNADSVSDLLDFANDGGDAGAEGGGTSAVNADLSKVITGDAAMEPVAPSKDIKAAASIAQQFGDDGALAGRLAHDLAADESADEPSPPSTGFGRNFVSIYKKLMAGQPAGSSQTARSRAARARAPVLSGALPINTKAVQRALEPRAAHAPESGRQAWLKRWAQETRDETQVADGQPARRAPPGR